MCGRFRLTFNNGLHGSLEPLVRASHGQASEAIGREISAIAVAVVINHDLELLAGDAARPSWSANAVPTTTDECPLICTSRT